MKTIKNDIENEIIIKNSRFITYLFKVNDISEIEEKINSIKKIHPKATHHCYAYIIGNIQNSSNDNEPSSTAGKPMLNVLTKNNLNDILAITVRYFGGIKLGAGGLVRAYSSSVSKALDNVSIINLIEAFKISLKIDYSNQKDFEHLIKDQIIINKEFTSDITYTVLVDKDFINNLNNYKYQIIDNNCYIEKE